MLETMNARYRAFREVPFTERVEVRKSKIHGWGLFVVNKPIEPNEMVVEYLGEIVRPVVADIREKDYEEKGMGSCYLFRLDNDKIIDATATGNLGRFGRQSHGTIRENHDQLGQQIRPQASW